MKQSAKYSLALLCLVCLIFVCGFGFKFRCGKHKALLLFNSQPITNQTINNAGRHFKAGEKFIISSLMKRALKMNISESNLLKKNKKQTTGAIKYTGQKTIWLIRVSNILNLI